jgi:DNA-binding MarR family transcriptional regulator
MERAGDLFLFRINRLAAVAGRPLTRLCEGRYGITRREWRLIVVLSQEGPLVSTELARRASIEPPRASRAITVLVEHGLVERIPRPGDRRYIEIHLTERGRQVYASLYPVVVQIDAQLLSGLDAEEIAVLQKLWRRLEEGASRLTQAVPGLPKTNRRRK